MTLPTLVKMLLVFAFSLSASAQDMMGPRSDGGTDLLVEHFSTLASEVLSKVDFDPQDRALLERTLKSKSTHIVSVRSLIDVRYGTAVKNPKVVAWGSPGLIQFKQADAKRPDEPSYEKMMNDGEQMAHIVIHELFRASGEPVDNNFELSIGKYRLNEFQRPTPNALQGELYSTDEIRGIAVIRDRPEKDSRTWTFSSTGGAFIVLRRQGEWTYGVMIQNYDKNVLNQYPFGQAARNAFAHNARPPKAGWIRWAREMKPLRSAMSVNEIVLKSFLSNSLLIDVKAELLMSEMKRTRHCKASASLKKVDLEYSEQVIYTLPADELVKYLDSRVADKKLSFVSDYATLRNFGVCTLDTGFTGFDRLN